MKKALFLSLPSVSVHYTLTPVIDQLAGDGYSIIYYNGSEMEPKGNHNFEFRSYPAGFLKHYSDKIDNQTSYFDFGEMLIDASEGIMNFLLDEVNFEKPDFIIHSHLAVWGKLLAKCYKVPSITLYTTFVLDQRIMLPFFRETKDKTSKSANHVSEAINFYRKSSSLYKELGLTSKPDIWDIYINAGHLNISFILRQFQPARELFDDSFHYLGYPTEPIMNDQKKDLIYISMGTIVNQNLSIYQNCIDIFREMEIDVIISIGTKIDSSDFTDVPDHIQLKEFVNQREVLKKAKIFITRGGMASVHEAVYTKTPMIAIPVIPEQKLTGRTIEKLGIGVYSDESQLTLERLKTMVTKVIEDYDCFRDNISKVYDTIPVRSSVAASRQIQKFLSIIESQAVQA